MSNIVAYSNFPLNFPSSIRGVWLFRWSRRYINQSGNKKGEKGRRRKRERKMGWSELKSSAAKSREFDETTRPSWVSARKVAEFGAVKRVAVLSNKHCDTSQELPEAAGYYEVRVKRVKSFCSRRRLEKSTSRFIVEPKLEFWDPLSLSVSLTGVLQSYWERSIVLSRSDK